MGSAVLPAGPGFISPDGNAFSPNQAAGMPANTTDSNLLAPAPARAPWSDGQAASADRFSLRVEQAVDQFFAGPEVGLLLDEWADDLALHGLARAGAEAPARG